MQIQKNNSSRRTQAAASALSFFNQEDNDNHIERETLRYKKQKKLLREIRVPVTVTPLSWMEDIHDKVVVFNGGVGPIRPPDVSFPSFHYSPLTIPKF